jgi:hypothetical protein
MIYGILINEVIIKNSDGKDYFYRGNELLWFNTA